MISAERIPNNVNLSEQQAPAARAGALAAEVHPVVARHGPGGLSGYHQVYLRTAISVDTEGWAHFDYVKMPEYRWGIFLADPVRRIAKVGFGDYFGAARVAGSAGRVSQRAAAAHRHAGRYRAGERRAAAAARRSAARSLYDLRNLFQVNVEEGRHLWAMVYLLHSYFGRDGRDEAEELLERQSGNPDKPRILEAFNEPIDNWLDFFMFTMFTDRDGKSQLMSLSESSLDPLSRTTRFMLTEEAHHMFVGETGIARILERTCQLMKEAGFSEDVRKIGGIDIPTIQKHLNQWFSLSLDLHGSEVSSNAAVVFRERPQGPREGRHVRRARRQGADLQDGVLRGRQGA